MTTFLPGIELSRLFPARAAELGDERGAQVRTARLCREAARLMLLLSRRWPPYPPVCRAVTAAAHPIRP